MDIIESIKDFMRESECPLKLKGYNYFKDCQTVLVGEDPTTPNNVMYADLMTKYRTSYKCVEHCLQTFLDQTWQNVSRIIHFAKKPSIREFLLKCADYIIAESRRPRSIYDVIFKTA